MLTWQLDRFLRAGPFCAIVTFVVPAVLAVVIAGVSDIENVIGIVLLAAGIMFLGSLFGSVTATGFGIALFGVGAAVGELDAPMLLLIGVVLFATVVVHDLSGAFRRAPKIHPGIWRNALVVVLTISTASVAMFSVAYLIATLATWKSIVVPFGIAAVGFAAKLAADSHATKARELTKKRVRDPDQEIS